MIKIILIICGLLTLSAFILIYGPAAVLIAIGLSIPILFLIGAIVSIALLCKLASYLWECLVDVKDWLVY